MLAFPRKNKQHFYHNFLQLLEEMCTYSPIAHFTVVCWVTWPLSRSEAGGDLVLMQTSLSFSCKCELVSITTTWFTWEKQWGLYQNKVTPSLGSTQRPGHSTHNCKMGYFTSSASTVQNNASFSRNVHIPPPFGGKYCSIAKIVYNWIRPVCLRSHITDTVNSKINNRGYSCHFHWQGYTHCFKAEM